MALLAAGTVVMAVAPAHAQLAGYGAVRGRVVDAGGDPLLAAQVEVAGTALGTITAADGSFVLSNLPEGAVELRVSLIGYETLTQRMRVIEGEVLERTFVLAPVVVGLDRVVVEGTESVGGVPARWMLERLAFVALVLAAVLGGLGRWSGRLSTIPGTAHSARRDRMLRAAFGAGVGLAVGVLVFSPTFLFGIPLYHGHAISDAVALGLVLGLREPLHPASAS